jgi:hypothetical protein
MTWFISTIIIDAPEEILGVSTLLSGTSVAEVKGKLLGVVETKYPDTHFRINVEPIEASILAQIRAGG